MTEDTSLDQFLDAGSEGDEGSATDTASDGSTHEEAVETGADAEDETDGVAPATVTVRYDPDGVPCPSCGETVTRRWRDDEAFVCGECKAW